MRMQMRKARKWLAITWFSLGFFFVFLVVVQCLVGVYADKADQAINWLLPTIMPTLALIIAVLGADALGLMREQRWVSRFLFQLTLGISLAYLLLVSLTVLLAPFSPMPRLELMRMSNFWLAPMQSLVAAALTVFFVRKEPPESADS